MLGSQRSLGNTLRNRSTDSSRTLFNSRTLHLVPSPSQTVPELIAQARGGSSCALRELYSRYTPFVYQICKRFFLPGADTEDLVQEGLTGIHQAIMTWEPSRGRTFEDFASLCVRNQIVRSVRHATRRKHMLLTEAASIHAEGSHMDRPSGGPGPEDQVLGALAMGDWLRLISTCLSDLEREVMHARLQGETNQQLATRLGVERKQLENALFRARRKLADAAQREDLIECRELAG